MLAEYLLNLVIDPEKLSRLKKNRDQLEAGEGLSPEEREAIKEGDLHSLRALLYRDVTRAGGGSSFSQRLGFEQSSYTVSTSGDTPHIPINMSGLFDASFWSTMDPACLWESEGLTIVGTGIRAGLQTTPESLICIRQASKVLFLVADLLTQAWITKINPKAESMQHLYKKGKYRLDIYNEIVDTILSNVRKQKDVCVVFYGHPGAFVYPAHEAIRLARKEGFKARMLPGVSAEDNLCADLGVDPGVAGAQSYEATNFVLNKYRFDPSAGLILWQIGLFGYAYWDPQYKGNPEALKELVEYLKEFYKADHEVVLYEASEFPLGNARVQRLSLAQLPETTISGVATLYIPPKSLPSIDLAMAQRLHIPVAK